MSAHLDRLKAALADRYAIDREIGSGGMATVYLAHDIRHERNVAVKVLRPELAAVLGAERFVQEIKTTAHLQHPNILPLFDSGEADGFLYYVMPYIEGETLRNKLERERQLGIEEAVRIATEVAEALDSAHRHGVIHRDIKPENVLLHDGRPMVADFGIALAVSAAAGGRMTETGLSLGTPHYMSPEQATAEKEITERSDIYSLGSVLYEMLTGSPPHVGSSAQQIIMRIVTEEAQPVTQVRRSVPPQLARTVAKALEKLPADRFSSAHELAEALKGRVTLAAGPDRRGATAPAAGGWRVRLHDPFFVVPSLLAIGLAVALLVFRSPAHDLRPVRAELDPPRGTEYAEQQFAALSPDGRRLAFVALGSSGARQIWIRDLETGSVDSFPTTRGAEAPFWSPTGRSLGFFLRSGLWRLELDGTIPRQLCYAADVGGSWSKQDLILFTYRGQPMTVPGEGGACEAVPGGWADSDLAVFWPVWYPDGHHFAALTSIHIGAGRILRGSLAGDSPRTVLEGVSAVGLVEPHVLVFGRNGIGGGSDVIAQRYDPKTLDPSGRLTTLAQGVRRDAGIPSYAIGATRLVYLPVPTSRGADEGPLLVDTEGAVLDSLAVRGTWTWRYSGDGHKVALGGDGLWLYDLDRGTPLAVRTSESALNFPVWSPGDSMLVVTALVADNECGLMLGPLRLIRLGSGIDVALTNTSADVACAVASDWTADGELLILTAFESRSTRGSVWTYALATGEMDRLVSVEGTASAAVVSPDMQWLAYVSDQTGELQVYVRPFRRDGPAVPVSTDGGALPRWRRDGRALFYQAPDGSVRRVTVGAGSSLALGAPEVLFHAPRWSVRLFADQLNGMQITTPYDVSPDGRRFLVRESTHETSAAVLVINWQSLLEDEANNQ